MMTGLESIPLSSSISATSSQPFYDKISGTREAVDAASENSTKTEKEDSANHNSGYVEFVKKNKS